MTRLMVTLLYLSFISVAISLFIGMLYYNLVVIVCSKVCFCILIQ